MATDAFVDLLLLEAEQRGMPDLPYIVVPHPIGGLQEGAVTEKAEAALDDLLAALAAPGVAAAAATR